ncbi:hypothetical protein [Sulfolobus islandicus rod-shaped virus 3]|uniref:XisI protein n=1 Tax=Sulfolobus islandicus rod-shaped virus 3 TaxID=2848124 RepID=A0A1B3SN04_9VIRU|nr:hypothetical protein BHS13_gp03 [Sulfolobus islandicus rudivirus 3]AOG61563.1 hypothetical protein [Sulfolobus islandicus rod-shaped virus 3]
MNKDMEEVIDTVQRLIQENIIGEKVVSFENSIDLHIQEFEWVIEVLIYADVKHYWFTIGREKKRYDIFIFDNTRELKRIIIESHFNVERIFIDSIQLIRYPR